MRRDEAAVAGLDREQVIDFYRRSADEVERKLGLQLRSTPAAEGRTRKP